IKLKKVLQVMSIEHKTHRLSSRALAHLDGLLDEALEQTFPARAMLSRSISSVNHTTQRHDFSIPALCSPATGRWASGLHRNTNACPRAVERVLTAEMRSKVPVALHAATSGPASRLFNV